MLYSILTNDDFTYINLHAEEAFDFKDDFQEITLSPNASKLLDNKKGIYTRTISSLVLNNIIGETTAEKDLVLDFSYIWEISQNNKLYLMSVVTKYLNIEKEVHFINIENKIKNEIIELATLKGYKIKSEERILHIFLNDEKDNLGNNDFYNNKVKTIYQKKLRKLVAECVLNRGNSIHSSTTVYLKKYINIKKIFLQGKERFFCFCLYHLVLQLIDKKIVYPNYIDNREIKLFFHTLNGAYIGGILAALLQLDTVYLDHLGPINSIKKKHFEKSLSNSNKYIIVSDVICTSAEVGRAETIIEYNGGTILSRVSFVDIETVKPLAQNQISCCTIKANDNFINYSIKTELCNNCNCSNTMEDKKDE